MANKYAEFSKAKHERDKRLHDASVKNDLSQCFKKARYNTEHQAIMAKERAESQRDVNLRVYFCPVCSGFHLTKKPLEKDA